MAHRSTGAASIYAREGVQIERSTMSGWIGQGERLLDPLVVALGRYVLAGSKLHADDTPVAVLSPGRGRTKTGRLWVYVRDDRASGSADAPAAWLRYSPDRKGEHPQAHLKDFKGVLQADAYAGFAKLYADGGIVEASCWAHYLERRFTRSNDLRSQVRRGVAQSLAPHKTEPARRQTDAKPLWETLHAWLCLERSRVPDGSSTARALLNYSLNAWTALTQNLLDGDVNVDNNLPVPRVASLQLPVSAWLGRTMRPRFLVSMCNIHREAVVHSAPPPPVPQVPSGWTAPSGPA